MIIIGLLNSENRSPLWGFHFGQTRRQYSINIINKQDSTTLINFNPAYKNTLGVKVGLEPTWSVMNPTRTGR
jgi:hypothetical protein